MGLIRTPWTRQPQSPIAVDWSSSLLIDVDFVLLGSHRFYNPAAKRVLTHSLVPVSSGTGNGFGPIYSTSAREYISLLEPVATGGTNEWTIAGIFMPTGTLTDGTGSAGQAVVGTCEAPASATRDRSISQSSGKWAGYLSDGAEKVALSTFAPVVGRTDRIIVVSKTTTLTISVNGEPAVSTVTVNNGFNAYATAEFIVGNASSVVQIGGVSVPLLIRARKAWSASEQALFFANPWRIVRVPPRGTSPGVSAATGFKAAYARGSNSVINAGITR